LSKFPSRTLYEIEVHVLFIQSLVRYQLLQSSERRIHKTCIGQILWY